ncbi:Tyrosine-protein phosphatase non-receptor type 12 [Heterocephalus glaber]|uniref:Tyrosine-protein phosphatase non-receptor type 12 n=1 Tax=Heterocephalus glaber TaxID=10181 RepID=G5B4K8_HETGA|nr:Tyrosine-protein phosphatase non-receptor type 12 [Heterocephalus glaber]
MTGTLMVLGPRTNLAFQQQVPQSLLPPALRAFLPGKWCPCPLLDTMQQECWVPVLTKMLMLVKTHLLPSLNELLNLLYWQVNIIPIGSEWSDLHSQKWSEQRQSKGLVTSGSEKCDHRTAGLPETCTESPLTVNDKKDQMTEGPAEATDTAFGNLCGKPKGPRDPPSEWT